MPNQIRNRLTSLGMTAAGVVALALGQATSAQTVTTLTSPLDFSGGETVIDFEEASPPILGNEYDGLGVEFRLSDANPPGVWDLDIPHEYGPFYGPRAITNVYSDQDPLPEIAIFFDSPIDRVAFEVTTDHYSDLELWIICVDNNYVVDIQFFETDQNYRFVGVESDHPFDSVYVDATGPLGIGLFFIDNLRFEATQLYTAPFAVAGGPYMVAVGESITLDGSYSTDPQDDPLTYSWWTDRGPFSGPEPVYTAGSVPGVFTAYLTVNDGCLDSEPAETEIVVYDPAGGYVSGSGWIWSDPGDLVDQPLLAGRARFGFMSKYEHNGAQVPTGETEFRFKKGNLHFHSSSYQWLVVNQGFTNAQYKGRGTINDEASPSGEDYNFMIWATDGADDTFRIKIWWEDEDGQEWDVYDCEDTVLGGGKIKVQD